jgi:UDP-glucose 4-epimerase
MKTEKRKALVTGGAGFLGPHLIKALLDQGWAVASMDNYSNGKRAHIQPFLPNPNFVSFEGSIANARFVDRAMTDFRPDVIYHLAAIHFIPYCVANPAETLEVNVIGTQRLIDAIEKAPVERFVLASTGDVYAPSDEPHKETAALGSTNIYGSSKEFCERLLALARHRFPTTRFLATRFFNIYGPGETNPHVLPDIMACLRKGNVLRLGNIEPKRDYVYVTDVADALLRLADYDGSHEVFNVATGESRSVRELILALEKVLGTRITVATDPTKLRKAERQHLNADITLIGKECGWVPKVSLEEGLAETLRMELETAAPVIQKGND